MTRKPVRFPKTGLIGREDYPFEADPALIEAANVAVTLEIPLLLTGEPGCGKTDFAFALARYVAGNRSDWDPDDRSVGLLECYVRSDTRSKDLLYHYDAVRRFADAHHGGPDERKEAEDARRYIDLMPLGIGLTSSTQRVVLVDEIDKAPRDLPNDLLRELDQGQFEIPEIPENAHARYPNYPDRLKRTMGLRRGRRSQAQPKPMIVITSNEERQLPAAFLRRCAFCHIEFPRKHALKRILNGRFDGLSESRQSAAIETFMSLRARRGLLKAPSTSELLRWVQALHEVFEPREREEAFGFNPESQSWSELPGLSCLIKLNEDRERLLRENPSDVDPART